MTCNGSFDTQSVRPWNEPRPQTSQVIKFPTSFEYPPAIALGLSVLDIAHAPNPRVTAYTTDITNTSASFHADSEAGSTLYTATTNWLGVDPRDSDIQIGHFSTTEVYPRDKPQSLTSCRVDFARPFAQIPKVISLLRQFDFSKDHGWRIATEATHIDRNGFTIHVKSWGDTVLYSATASWVAYTPTIGDIYGGSVNTLDARSWSQPTALTSKAVEFQGMSFTKIPNVFFGLNSLDMSCGPNMRIKCAVDNVGRNGLTWHIDTWANTAISTAGISYLCFVPRAYQAKAEPGGKGASTDGGGAVRGVPADISKGSRVKSDSQGVDNWGGLESKIGAGGGKGDTENKATPDHKDGMASHDGSATKGDVGGKGIAEHHNETTSKRALETQSGVGSTGGSPNKGDVGSKGGADGKGSVDNKRGAEGKGAGDVKGGIAAKGELKGSPPAEHKDVAPGHKHGKGSTTALEHHVGIDSKGRPEHGEGSIVKVGIGASGGVEAKGRVEGHSDAKAVSGTEPKTHEHVREDGKDSTVGSIKAGSGASGGAEVKGRLEGHAAVHSTASHSDTKVVASASGGMHGGGREDSRGSGGAEQKEIVPGHKDGKESKAGPEHQVGRDNKDRPEHEIAKAGIGSSGGAEAKGRVEGHGDTKGVSGTGPKTQDHVHDDGKDIKVGSVKVGSGASSGVDVKGRSEDQTSAHSSATPSDTKIVASASGGVHGGGKEDSKGSGGAEHKEIVPGHKERRESKAGPEHQVGKDNKGRPEHGGDTIVKVGIGAPGGVEAKGRAEGHGDAKGVSGMGHKVHEVTHEDWKDGKAGLVKVGSALSGGADVKGRSEGQAGTHSSAGPSDTKAITSASGGVHSGGKEDSKGSGGTKHQEFFPGHKDDKESKAGHEHQVGKDNRDRPERQITKVGIGASGGTEAKGRVEGHGDIKDLKYGPVEVGSRASGGIEVKGRSTAAPSDTKTITSITGGAHGRGKDDSKGSWGPERKETIPGHEDGKRNKTRPEHHVGRDNKGRPEHGDDAIFKAGIGASGGVEPKGMVEGHRDAKRVSGVGHIIHERAHEDGKDSKAGSVKVGSGISGGIDVKGRSEGQAGVHSTATTSDTKAITSASGGVHGGANDDSKGGGAEHKVIMLGHNDGKESKAGLEYHVGTDNRGRPEHRDDTIVKIEIGALGGVEAGGTEHKVIVLGHNDGKESKAGLDYHVGTDNRRRPEHRDDTIVKIGIGALGGVEAKGRVEGHGDIKGAPADPKIHEADRKDGKDLKSEPVKAGSGASGGIEVKGRSEGQAAVHSTAAPSDTKTITSISGGTHGGGKDDSKGSGGPEHKEVIPGHEDEKQSKVSPEHHVGKDNKGRTEHEAVKVGIGASAGVEVKGRVEGHGDAKGISGVGHKIHEPAHDDGKDINVGSVKVGSGASGGVDVTGRSEGQAAVHSTASHSDTKTITSISGGAHGGGKDDSKGSGGPEHKEVLPGHEDEKKSKASPEHHVGKDNQGKPEHEAVKVGIGASGGVEVKGRVEGHGDAKSVSGVGHEIHEPAHEDKKDSRVGSVKVGSGASGGVDVTGRSEGQAAVHSTASHSDTKVVASPSHGGGRDDSKGSEGPGHKEVIPGHEDGKESKTRPKHHVGEDSKGKPEHEVVKVGIGASGGVEVKGRVEGHGDAKGISGVGHEIHEPAHGDGKDSKVGSVKVGSGASGGVDVTGRSEGQAAVHSTASHADTKAVASPSHGGGRDDSKGSEGPGHKEVIPGHEDGKESKTRPEHQVGRDNKGRPQHGDDAIFKAGISASGGVEAKGRVEEHGDTKGASGVRPKIHEPAHEDEKDSEAGSAKVGSGASGGIDVKGRSESQAGVHSTVGPSDTKAITSASGGVHGGGKDDSKGSGSAEHKEIVPGYKNDKESKAGPEHQFGKDNKGKPEHEIVKVGIGALGSVEAKGRVEGHRDAKGTSGVGHEIHEHAHGDEKDSKAGSVKVGSGASGGVEIKSRSEGQAGAHSTAAPSDTKVITSASGGVHGGGKDDSKGSGGAEHKEIVPGHKDGKESKAGTDHHVGTDNKGRPEHRDDTIVKVGIGALGGVEAKGRVEGHGDIKGLPSADPKIHEANRKDGKDLKSGFVRVGSGGSGGVEVKGRPEGQAAVHSTAGPSDTNVVASASGSAHERGRDHSQSSVGTKHQEFFPGHNDVKESKAGHEHQVGKDNKDRPEHDIAKVGIGASGGTEAKGRVEGHGDAKGASGVGRTIHEYVHEDGKDGKPGSVKVGSGVSGGVDVKAQREGQAGVHTTTGPSDTKVVTSASGGEHKGDRHEQKGTADNTGGSPDANVKSRAESKGHESEHQGGAGSGGGSKHDDGKQSHGGLEHKHGSEIKPVYEDAKSHNGPAVGERSTKHTPEAQSTAGPGSRGSANVENKHLVESHHETAGKSIKDTTGKPAHHPKVAKCTVEGCMGGVECKHIEHKGVCKVHGEHCKNEGECRVDEDATCCLQ